MKNLRSKRIVLFLVSLLLLVGVSVPSLAVEGMQVYFFEVGQAAAIIQRLAVAEVWMSGFFLQVM